MKIFSVNTLSPNPSRINSNKLNKKNSALTPSFHADRFDGGSIADYALQNLNDTVNETLVPFINKHKEKYQKAGYAGIELQGIIDEYQKQNSDFFTTGLNEKKKYKIFDTVEKEIQDYNQYRKNIREFDALSKMAANPLYGSSEIQQKVQKIKPLFSETSLTFENKKKLCDFYEKTYEKAEDEISNIKLTDMPVYPKIKNAQELYMQAISVVVSLPVTEAVKIKTETDALMKSNEKNYVKMQKAEYLENRLYSGNLIKSIENADKNSEETDDFLKKYNELKPDDNLKEEIKQSYKLMKEKRSNSVKSAADSLSDYYKNEYNPVSDKSEIKRVLNAQKKANERLWQIIDAAKKEYIEKQNAQFFSGYKIDE